MDPKPQMPDIKAEVNKIDDGKKKSAGLMGLLGGGGGGTAGGLGGLGAGAVGGGGLLATKAGMLALVLMGSAVAGGIGLAGYKMFGPGEADRTGGGNLSLFAPRTQPAGDPNAVAPVNADGSSASLNFASAAAAKDKAEADAAAAAAAAASSASAEAPKDNTAEDPAKAAAAADAARREAEARASAGKGSMGGGGGSGAAGTMNLAGTKKLGALSSNIGGGGGSTSASASSKLGDSLANAAKNGASSAFSRQGGAAAKASSARGIASHTGRSARSQARNVMGDQGGGKAGSSFAAGRTYDGSTAGGGGAIGPNGGDIGMGGVGDGAGAQAKTLPANSKGSTKEQDPPVPEPPAKDVTPWAKQIMIGMALGAVAVGLMMWASSIIKEAKTKVVTAIGMMEDPATMEGGIALYTEALGELQTAKIMIMAGIAAALGGVMMGAMIAGGKNGQTLQGGLLIASSGVIAALGTTYLLSASDPTPASGFTTSKEDADLLAFKAPPTWMTVIGGVAAVGLVGTMLAPKKTCKADQDSCHAYYQQQPSPSNYLV